ncbi:hypothetical protein BC830DRAFT_1146466 [Chytriomyces sp. MP71]|nr:hypothetical protein BC830DRAFT_1146466 [Chytriomyces sp. MP71]
MMPRVVAAMLSNAFSDVWDIDRVEAAHFSFNPASGRVMQKAGMTFEGTLRGMYKKDGKLIDGEMYSVLRRESQ